MIDRHHVPQQAKKSADLADFFASASPSAQTSFRDFVQFPSPLLLPFVYFHDKLKLYRNDHFCA